MGQYVSKRVIAPHTIMQTEKLCCVVWASLPDCVALPPSLTAAKETAKATMQHN